MDYHEFDNTKRQKTRGEVSKPSSNLPIIDAKDCPEESTKTCQFFIDRKKRFCKVPALLGNALCAEHSHMTKIEQTRKRIPCPLDPKHSCYEDQLEKHLRKCNARKELLPSCYEENINAGDKLVNQSSSVDGKTLEKFNIRDVPKEEVFDVIKKCKNLFMKYKNELVREEVLFHPALREAAGDPKNGASALKHINQQASLIGHMDRIGLLSDGHCYIEFGAGKGGLSHWVQRAFPSQNAQFILVDRSSVRYKMDSYHKGEDQGPSFERLKIDIQHLNLDKAKSIDNDRPIISIGKHLCGNATDLMLRCVVNTLHEKDNHKRYIKGISLAMCCHHRCDWNSYVGKEFITENGLSVNQFNIMRSMSSWAVCGNTTVQDKDYNHHFYGDLKPQDREEIGFQVKRLMELGRVRFLRQHGFTHTELVHFVDRECTPENVCLLAVKNSEACEKL